MSFRRIAMPAVAGLCCLILAAGASADGPPVGLQGAVNAAFGVERSRIVGLDLDTRPGRTVRTEIELGGVPYTVDLRPFSVRAASYQVLAQVADGSLVPVAPGPIRTLRGELLEAPGSLVAGGMSDDGLTATIHFADGKRFWVEPIARLVPSAPPGLHVVYEDVDVLASGGVCGNEFDRGPGLDDDHDHAPPAQATAGGTLRRAELACDADREYFQDYGSVSAVEARINTVTNTVNVQYENQVDITHSITVIIVRTAEPDPYSSSSSGALLCQFITEWTDNQQSIPFDVAKLFTGKSISGGTIGQAANFGEICDRQGCCGCGQFGFDDGAFCYSENDCCGSFACATDLMAHELGHLWDAVHCSCTNFTMNPFITCSNQFSSATINDIVAHRNTRTCLDLGQCAVQDLGACCLEGGSCDLFEEVECDALGGLFQGLGTTCGGVECSDAGACCFDDGSCVNTTESICTGNGGSYLGFGTDCGTSVCPSGACCLGDGSCQTFTESFCTMVGGTYQGEGTECAGADCGGADPCPQDIDGDRIIGFLDLLEVLSNWGPCGVPCPEDLDGDGIVGFLDLLDILSNWGPCSP